MFLISHQDSSIKPDDQCIQIKISLFLMDYQSKYLPPLIKLPEMSVRLLDSLTQSQKCDSNTMNGSKLSVDSSPSLAPKTKWY